MTLNKAKTVIWAVVVTVVCTVLVYVLVFYPFEQNGRKAAPDATEKAIRGSQQPRRTAQAPDEEQPLPMLPPLTEELWNRYCEETDKPTAKGLEADQIAQRMSRSQEFLQWLFELVKDDEEKYMYRKIAENLIFLSPGHSREGKLKNYTKLLKWAESAEVAQKTDGRIIAEVRGDVAIHSLSLDVPMDKIADITRRALGEGWSQLMYRWARSRKVTGKTAVMARGIMKSHAERGRKARKLLRYVAQNREGEFGEEAKRVLRKLKDRGELKKRIHILPEEKDMPSREDVFGQTQSVPEPEKMWDRYVEETDHEESRKPPTSWDALTERAKKRKDFREWAQRYIMDDKEHYNARRMAWLYILKYSEMATEEWIVRAKTLLRWSSETPDNLDWEDKRMRNVLRRVLERQCFMTEDIPVEDVFEIVRMAEGERWPYKLGHYARSQEVTAAQRREEDTMKYIRRRTKKSRRLLEYAAEHAKSPERERAREILKTLREKGMMNAELIKNDE